MAPSPKSRHANFKSSILQKHRQNRENNLRNGTVASPVSPLSAFPSSPTIFMRPFASPSPSSPTSAADKTRRTKLSTQERRRLLRQTADEEQRKKLLERQKREERERKGIKTPGRKRRNPTPPNSTVKRRDSESDPEAFDWYDNVQMLPSKRASTVASTKASISAEAQRCNGSASPKKESPKRSASPKKESPKKEASVQKEVVTEKLDSSPPVEEEAKPKRAVKKVKASRASDNDDDQEEGDSMYDKCAFKKCRRPKYENVNWVQCDDCDEWYHNVCILGVEKAVEDDEFHCGCQNNGKRKKRQQSAD
ncbi:transcription factor 19-like protein [Aphelenchoides avenae]|nr:transcription factor 19-like protein [Aphelenchus avenae]